MDRIAEECSELIVIAKDEKNSLALPELQEFEAAKSQLDGIFMRLVAKVTEQSSIIHELNRKIALLSDDLQSARDDLERIQQGEFANRRHFLEVIRQAGDVYSAAVSQIEQIRRDSREKFARQYEASRRRARDIASHSPQEARAIMTKARNDSLRVYQETEVQVLTLLEKAKLEALGLLDYLELEDPTIDMLDFEVDELEDSDDIPGPNAELALISDVDASITVEAGESNTGQVVGVPKVDVSNQASPVNTFEMIVSPFESFASLSAFYYNLCSLDEIAGLKILSFDRGTLHLEIEYVGRAPLLEKLENLFPAEAQLSRVNSECVQVTLC